MKFVDVNGILRKARRFVSAGGSVQDEEVKSPTKLAEILRQLQRRISDVEAVTPTEPVEFEVNVGTGGSLTSMAHNMNGAIRWTVVTWTQVGGTAVPTGGPELVQDATSTSNMLVLRSYRSGKAIVRVEHSFAGVDPGATVTTDNRAPKFAAVTADVTNTGAGAYVDLLSTTVVTEAANSFLVIQFASSFAKFLAAGGVYFEIRVDGVLVSDGTYVTVPINAAANAALQVKHAVTAGTHTVLVRWAGSPDNVRINAATNANEFASMFIQETVS